LEKESLERQRAEVEEEMLLVENEMRKVSDMERFMNE
jgi:hypothetical protein